MSLFRCCFGGRPRVDDYSHLYEQGYGHARAYHGTQHDYVYPRVGRAGGHHAIQQTRDLIESFAYQILNGNAASAFDMLWQKKAVLRIDIDGLKCMGAGIQFLGACCDEMTQNNLVCYFFKQMLATKHNHGAGVERYEAKIEFDLRNGYHGRPRLYKGVISFEVRHGLIYKMVMRQR